MDWDLEAPGLHLYFQEWFEQNNVPGLTEFIQTYVDQTYADGKDPNWQNFVITIALPQAKEPLLFMTAGMQDEFYVQRMQTLDWQTLYETRRLGNFLEKLRREWKQAFDFVLIDSRTGITDIGGICTVQLPDLICLLFTANAQSLYGAVDVVKRAMRLRYELPFDRNRLWVLPVATRFEARIEYELAQEWLEIFAKALSPLYEEWAHRDITPSDLLNFTKVPYVPYWSFGEKMPILKEGTKDPDSIGFAFETVAAMLALKLDSSDVLIKNRDSFVATARRGSIKRNFDKSKRDNQGVQVFFSYSYRDEILRDELAKHLKLLERQGIIQSWYDRQIEAGAEWVSQIDAHLEEANIILLLVSADFLASDYAYDLELKRALERDAAGEARVIPILLRPVDWKSSPFSQLQAFPKNGKPVTTWINRDEAFADVTRDIRLVAQDLIQGD